jgi:hypothetical protein
VKAFWREGEGEGERKGDLLGVLGDAAHLEHYFRRAHPETNAVSYNRVVSVALRSLLGGD